MKRQTDLIGIGVLKPIKLRKDGFSRRFLQFGFKMCFAINLGQNTVSIRFKLYTKNQGGKIAKFLSE